MKVVFHFDVPLCLEEGPFRSSTLFVLVLRDLPTSVQFFHDQINAVILYASSMTTSAAIRLSPLSCLKSHLPCRFLGKDPARVEDRVSIVGMCTTVWALRNMEVDPVQTAVPLQCPHQFFPTVLTLHNRIVPLKPVHQRIPEKIVVVATVQNNLSQKWQYRGTASTNTPTQTEIYQGWTKDARCSQKCFGFHDMPQKEWTNIGLVKHQTQLKKRCIRPHRL